MMSVMNNGARLTWLGHATWLLETPGGKRVIIDPWTDGNPSCPPAFHGEGLGAIDLILVTHGHGDHIGDLLPIQRRTGAEVAAIFDLTTWLQQQGVEPVTGGNKGGTMPVQGLKVTLVNAVHSSTFDFDGTRLDLGDPCGLIIELEDGYRIYNAGDTAVFGDMALIKELYHPDLCILPVGDFFTMGPLEAAKAVELLGATDVLCQHYGTFPLLTGRPADLRARVADSVTIHELAPGETLA
jgi:L-ascorbate metabolism protein UlaG (beta-lactamase superfamily)